MPPFRPTISLKHTFRYANGSNNGAFSITRANLLNQLLVAISAVTTTRLLQAVRLRSVEIWTNPTALGSGPNSTQIEWVGENSPSTIISDTTMGVTPAHIRTTPPQDSSNRWWSISGTSESDVLFTMSLALDSIIDVTVDLRYIDQEGPTAGDVPVGATVGKLYGNYLDGHASAKLTPIGYTALP